MHDDELEAKRARGIRSPRDILLRLPKGKETVQVRRSDEPSEAEPYPIQQQIYQKK